METKQCDWCENNAVWTAESGNACEEHRSELARCEEHRIWRTGNPYAGEAAEAAVHKLGR